MYSALLEALCCDFQALPILISWEIMGKSVGLETTFWYLLLIFCSVELRPSVFLIGWRTGEATEKVHFIFFKQIFFQGSVGNMETNFPFCYKFQGDCRPKTWILGKESRPNPHCDPKTSIRVESSEVKSRVKNHLLSSSWYWYFSVQLRLCTPSVLLVKSDSVPNPANFM